MYSYYPLQIKQTSNKLLSKVKYSQIKTIQKVIKLITELKTTAFKEILELHILSFDLNSI